MHKLSLQQIIKLFLIKLILIMGTPIQADEISVKELRDNCKILVNFDDIAEEYLEIDGFESKLIELVFKRTQCNTAIDTIIALGDQSCNTASVFNMFNDQILSKAPMKMLVYFPIASELKDVWKYVDLAEIFILAANKDPSKWNDNGYLFMSSTFFDVFPCTFND